MDRLLKKTWFKITFIILSIIIFGCVVLGSIIFYEYYLKNNFFVGQVDPGYGLENMPFETLNLDEIDFVSVNELYLKNSEGYFFDINKNEDDFIVIDLSEHIEKDVDWNLIYPYLYYAIEEESSCFIFRNQGLYMENEIDEFLVAYLNLNNIYLNLNFLENIATECDYREYLYSLDILFYSLDEINILRESSEVINDIFEILKVYEVKNEWDKPKLSYSEWKNMQEIKKPVIYLYPMEETDIAVNLYGAVFTTTYPQYNNGWFVTAYPDGRLVDKNGREYNYLYWEGLSKSFIDLREGFVIKKDNYIEFLETTLLEIGMIDTEINDFITYWLPQMNEYEYCFLSFQMENYEKEIQLKYNVEPDNELRVYVAFCGLDKYMDVQSQDLSYYDNFVRKGFVVVEWGGTFLDNTDALYYQQNYVEKEEKVLLDDSGSNIIDNQIDYSAIDLSIQNKDWWIFFQDKNIKTKEVLLEELKDLEIELSKSKMFNLENNKIFVTKYGKTSLFMIIEEYGVYLNLEAFQELKAKDQTQFFKYFFDWFEESSFDEDTIWDVADSFQQLDRSVATAILPIIYQPTCPPNYSPLFIDNGQRLSVLLIFCFIFLFCYLIVVISHRLISRSIKVEDGIKDYFFPYLTKEDKSKKNILKIFLFYLIIAVVFCLSGIIIGVISDDMVGILVSVLVIIHPILIVLFTLKSLSITFLNDICKDNEIGKNNSRVIPLFYLFMIVLPILLLLLLIFIVY